MSTDNGTTEKSNETKFFNQTTTDIVNIVNIISVCITVFSTIVQYLADKFASFFYGINSGLFHTQPLWSIIIDFFITVFVYLAIFLIPFIFADYYRNSLSPIKEGNNNEKTLKFLYPLLLILIIFYPLLSGCYVLYQYAVFFDSINKGCAFIIICPILLLFIVLWLTVGINKAQLAGKNKNWYLFLYCLLNNIIILFLLHFMGIYLLVLLILYNFFTVYYLATLYSFLDKNKFFSYTSNGCCIILALCFIFIPLSPGSTYYSGKKQYEIVEPISGSNIASGSNLKVVILHKDNQLLLMDFTTDENKKDGSAPSKGIEKQAQQSIEEILSKASASNLNIKKGEYTIQDENLYKFYTVTFQNVNCE